MKNLSKKDLTGLLEDSDGLHISLYLPTHVGDARQQDPIRLKNLLRDAKNQLFGLNLPNAEVDKMLLPAYELLLGPELLSMPEGGLVIFLKQAVIHWFHLPMSFEQLAVVANRYHIKPLLPYFAADGRFFVLALSQNEVRLFQCSSVGATEIALENVPHSLEEMLSHVEGEKQLQFHTGTPASHGARPAAYHGQGKGKDQAKNRILRFFQKVDRGIRDTLEDEKAPMVLAGVDYLLPIYRKASTYGNLVEQGVKGNPEETTPDALRQQAWELVQPLFACTRRQAMDKFHQLAETENASQELGPIVTAAHDGRIETLFVALGIQRWGAYDHNSRKIQLYGEERAGTEDMIDLAAIQTLLNSGTVYAVKPKEMPGNSPVVGIFRF